MSTIYSVKELIFKLREEVEYEFLSEYKNEEKLLELSRKLDELILIYIKSKS